MDARSRRTEPREVGKRQILETAILVVAIFAADIALARIVDVALDAFH